MKSIKRTRGVSHKKKKVTATVIKVENSRINASQSRKKPKTSSTSTPLHFTNQSPPTEDANDDTITDDAYTEDAIVIDLSYNLPKNKAKTFIAIAKDKINLSFRLGVDNFANMVPQISKEILSNFSYKYKRRATNTRRTGRIISGSNEQSSIANRMSSDTDGIEGISIANYTRCYVEDFMTRDIGESLLVLLPTRYAYDAFSSWFSLMSFDIKYIYICFTKHNYRGYIGIVNINPIGA